MKIETKKEKIITITDETGTEKVLEQGMAISFQGDLMTCEMVNIAPVDIVRAALGLLETVERCGYGDLFRAYLGNFSSLEEE